MKHTIYLALGTNLGDRLENIQAALKALSPDVQISAESPIYETPPWGYLDQPDFLNQVLMGETDLEPLILLRYLKRLEADLGRLPGVRYGPRQIDLDILFYDELILETPELTIPHPRLAERAFVLVPLADLAPDLCHPETGETVQDMLNKVDRQDIKLFKTS
jgi:2-amino-4-hydroxy-6-hydroxymethyldihydropteridine diphosphokinase